MAEPRIERIGLPHLVAAAPALGRHGEADLAGQLHHAALGFCRALARHRRSPAYRVRLKPPVELGLDPLVSALLGAADVLRQGSDEDAALGAWCCALAARLGAVLTEPDPCESRVLLFIDVAPTGLGELLLMPVPALDDIPGFEDPE